MRIENNLINHEKKEGLTPQMRLVFVRHDAHSNTKPDEKSRLTLDGRKHAQGVGRAANPIPEMGSMIVSPRERTLDTAAREFYSEEKWLSEDVELEEIMEHIPHWKKPKISEFLNYKTDANEKYKEAFYEHFKKDALSFLVNESDDMVKELGDLEDHSYSRFAANLAELIKWHVEEKFPQWERIYSKKQDKYQNKTEAQRFLGSHSLILDSFIMKLIEKVEGREGLDRFLEDWPSETNITELGENFSVMIKRIDDEVLIKVNFRDKSWKFGLDIIEDIINDRIILDNNIKERLKKIKRTI